jgi:hypothetical protein
MIISERAIEVNRPYLRLISLISLGLAIRLACSEPHFNVW